MTKGLVTRDYSYNAGLASGKAIPLTKSQNVNDLYAAETYEYLNKAGNVYKKSMCLGSRALTLLCSLHCKNVV